MDSNIKGKIVGVGLFGAWPAPDFTSMPGPRFPASQPRPAAPVVAPLTNGGPSMPMAAQPATPAAPAVAPLSPSAIASVALPASGAAGDRVDINAQALPPAPNAPAMPAPVMTFASTTVPVQTVSPQ